MNACTCHVHGRDSESYVRRVGGQSVERDGGGSRGRKGDVVSLGGQALHIQMICGRKEGRSGEEKDGKREKGSGENSIQTQRAGF